MRAFRTEELADWFGVSLDIPLTPVPWASPSFNIAPQTAQPIVRFNPATSKCELAPLRWGLIPSWARNAKIGLNTINARTEDVETKPAFRSALKSKRCLVPASGFYEWQKITAKQKQPFAIALKARTPLAFAGLWDLWHDADGTPLETFTILTTAANQLMKPIHNRMPVILQPEDYSRWLGEPPSSSTPSGNSLQAPLDLLQQFDPEQMEAWPISDAVGNVRNNSPELAQPVEPRATPQPNPSLFD